MTPAEQRSAYLRCRACGQDTLHEVSYAGRLLYASRCTHCGHEVRHGEQDFAGRYLLDLEHRLLTKPRRLARRARSHPLAFARSLPTAVARQPGKLRAELRTVLADVRRRRG
ncbi:MAG TPA: hypothetical protein VFL94_00070 [Actinomycetales bacterium]|nr:hypothetical protein [Actinomycetales bacterium]